MGQVRSEIRTASSLATPTITDKSREQSVPEDVCASPESSMSKLTLLSPRSRPEMPHDGHLPGKENLHCGGCATIHQHRNGLGLGLLGSRARAALRDGPSGSSSILSFFVSSDCLSVIRSGYCAHGRSVPVEIRLCSKRNLAVLRNPQAFREPGNLTSSGLPMGR